MSSDALRDAVAQGLGDRRTVIALSGGIDSVVLLHASVRAGREVVATHVDHGLREDSGDDARFCEELAAELLVPFERISIEVARGNSTQGRARHQRYAALFRSSVRFAADCVATAHHADDAVESAWLQAARGAGPIGRAGPERELRWWGFTVVRPLLDVSRDQIEGYARTHDLRWREDPSNADLGYARSRLRHEVLDAAVDPAEARASMPRLRQAARVRREAVDRLRRGEESAPNFRRFNRSELASATPEALGRLLLDTASDLHGAISGDLARSVVDAIADEETETRRFTGSRVVVEVSGDLVTFEASRGQGTRLLDSRRTVAVSVFPGDEVPWFRRTVRVPDDLDCDGLTLRGARPGERIVTDVGSQLVYDLLAERDVPPSDRWWWPCLFDDDRCLEVVGVASAA